MGQIRLPTAWSRTRAGTSAVVQKADHILALALVVSWVPHDSKAVSLRRENARQLLIGRFASMSLTFYERVGHEGRRPSPFSWRIRYALAHKGVPFEVRPVRFADVETIRNLSGQHLTPILKHGDDVVHETWDIACYLEEQFPDRPSLFGGEIGRGIAHFINAWSETQLGPPLRRVIYADFPAVLDSVDRAYFRASRERALGMSLEDACADPESKLTAFQEACVPLTRVLTAQPYICGAAPAYGDYIVFSLFQMVRLGSPKEVIAEGSAIATWRTHMIALFDDLGNRFPGYPK